MFLVKKKIRLTIYYRERAIGEGMFGWYLMTEFKYLPNIGIESLDVKKYLSN